MNGNDASLIRRSPSTVDIVGPWEDLSIGRGLEVLVYSKCDGAM